MSSRKLSVHTEHEFLLKMEGAGLGEEEAQAVIESEENKIAKELVDLICFHRGPITDDWTTDDWTNVVVDYSQSLADMIAACRYNSISRKITADHFPAEGKGRVELRMALLHFKKAMATKDVIAGLERSGFRPAKVEELLAFCEKRPGLRLRAKFSIAPLGSVWNDSNSEPNFVVFSGERLLCGPAGTTWEKSYRFAAVL